MLTFHFSPKANCSIQIIIYKLLNLYKCFLKKSLNHKLHVTSQACMNMLLFKISTEYFNLNTPFSGSGFTYLLIYHMVWKCLRYIYRCLLVNFTHYIHSCSTMYNIQGSMHRILVYFDVYIFIHNTHNFYHILYLNICPYFYFAALYYIHVCILQIIKVSQN